MTNLTQVPMYSSFNDLVDLALSDDPHYVDCSFSIEHEGTSYHCYHASIAHRDILLYTDKGTVTYLVDSINGNHTAVLYDWTLDEEES